MRQNILHNKYIYLGTALFLLAAVLSCGSGQLLNQQETSGSGDCTNVLSSAILHIKDNTLVGAFFVLLVALAFAVAHRGIFNRTYAFTQQTIRINFNALRLWQFTYKLYNPILQALRRGILSPQIYNFAVATR